MEITHKNVKKDSTMQDCRDFTKWEASSVLLKQKNASELDSRHARFYLIKLSVRIPCVYNVLWLISVYLQILKAHMRTLLTVFHNSSWKNISMKSL